MKKQKKQITNSDILEFVKICKNLGILNFADLKRFIVENVQKNQNIFECLKSYYKNLKEITKQEKFNN